ncbi:MAG: protein ninG [Herminiimonas sp.]|nr:protein ninG [Herminiimonas sp.]
MIRSAIAAKPRMKKCAICPDQFTVQRMGQKVCGPMCAIRHAALAKAKAQKAEAALTRAQLQDLQKPHYWAKRAEKHCNAFIRLRDQGDPCISCGTYDAPEWHAGHCYTVAARPDIRYHEDNIHLQCPSCNTYKGGMVGDYKVRVASKIGQERLDALAYVNPAYKKTREYYQSVEAFYKARIKEFKREAA